MMEMAAKDIERLGGTVEMVDIGKQKVRECGSVAVNVKTLSKKKLVSVICNTPVHLYLIIGYALFFHGFHYITTVLVNVILVLI